METLDIHELVEHLNEVLQLMEEGETIELTNNGKVIAHIVPTHKLQHTGRQDADPAWAKLRALGDELSKYWPTDVDAVEVVRDIRRDL